MELRGLVREQLSRPLSILTAIAAVRAHAQRRRGILRARERVVSFLGPFLFGEGCPFALFDLPNQRRPGLRLRVKGELVRQLAISKFEFKREKLVVEFATAKRGIFCAENIDP